MENNVKISEQYPKFGFGSLFDEILDGFGGVLEIFSCDWNDIELEGEIVCLMNDWRVFRYYLKQSNLSGLDKESRVKMINKDCILFEDIDEYSSWKEVDGDDYLSKKKIVDKLKKDIEYKKEVDEYLTDLGDFFNGNIEKMQKKMIQNKGV